MRPLTPQPPISFPVDPSGPPFLFRVFPFPSCRPPARPTVTDSVPSAETLAPVFECFSQIQTLSIKHIHLCIKVLDHTNSITVIMYNCITTKATIYALLQARGLN